jgi:RNA polymerase sigma-70 factor (ECF subfamily)
MRRTMIGHDHVGSPMVSGNNETPWSKIFRARGKGRDARAAGAELYQRYWQPVFLMARRSGRTRHEAEDLVNGFALHIVEHEALATLDPARGRFRDWLKAAFKNFLHSEIRYHDAKKRGSAYLKLSIDEIAREQQWVLTAAGRTPDEVYDCRFARQLLSRALDRIKTEYWAEQRGDWYEQLKGTLTGRKLGYEQLSRQLGVTEEALRKRAKTLRGRYDRLLNEEIRSVIADTVDPAEERRALQAVLANCCHDEHGVP